MGVWTPNTHPRYATGPWGPSSLLHNRYRVFAGGKERPGRDANPTPLLVPWSRKSRARPLLPLCAVRPVQSLSACTRVHCTFTFTYRGCYCSLWTESFLSVTYLITPWFRVLLEKVTGLQPVKKFPAFHGTRKFITALTRVPHLSLSWASPIQSIYPHLTTWRSILILSTHLRLDLPSGLIPSGYNHYTSLTSRKGPRQKFPFKCF